MSPFLVNSTWTSSVSLSIMDGPSTYRKSLPALILRVLRHALIQKPLWELKHQHGQSSSLMATTKTETTRWLTYSVARVIDIIAWQSVDTICLCCLTHGVCVSHWTPTSSHNSTMEVARVLWSVHAISMTCSVCWTSLCAAWLHIIARPDSQFLCTHVYFFFCDHT